MTPGEYIALIGLIMFWIITLITFWVRIKINLAELDIKIKNVDKKLDAHIAWGLGEFLKNEQKFTTIASDLKDNYKELVNKIDILIDKFADFRVYLEKKVKD